MTDRLLSELWYTHHLAALKLSHVSVFYCRLLLLVVPFLCANIVNLSCVKDSLPGKFHKHGNLDADGKSFCPLVMMAERAIKRIFHFKSCGVGFVSLVSADMQTETACFG